MRAPRPRELNIRGGVAWRIMLSLSDHNAKLLKLAAPHAADIRRHTRHFRRTGTLVARKLLTLWPPNHFEI